MQGTERQPQPGATSVPDVEPRVQLRCLACSGSVDLADHPTSCACGQSSARPDARGHAYGGPARPTLAMLVHEPSVRAMVTREAEIADTDHLHRVEVGPRI